MKVSNINNNKFRKNLKIYNSKFKTRASTTLITQNAKLSKIGKVNYLVNFNIFSNTYSTYGVYNELYLLNLTK